MPLPHTMTPSRLLLLSLLTVSGAMVSATAASVYAAGDAARRLERSVKPHALPDAGGSGSASGLTRLVDSLVAPLGSATPLDSGTMRRVLAVITKPSDRGWILRPVVSVADTASLTLYRAWVHSAAWPTLWGYAPQFGDTVRWHAIPIRRLQPVKRWWTANEHAADSALMRGDVGTALVRARENIAGARHLMNQPLAIDALVGRAMLVDGAKLLARIALQADDIALHTAAERLLQQSRAFAPVPRGSLALLARAAADPSSPELLAMAADTAQLRSRRVLTLERLTAGVCFNTREMLFGAAHARHETLDRAIAAMHDIPRLPELRPALHRELDEFSAGPSRLPARTYGPAEWTSAAETALRWLLPRTIEDRVDYCRSLS